MPRQKLPGIQPTSADTATPGAAPGPLPGQDVASEWRTPAAIADANAVRDANAADAALFAETMSPRSAASAAEVPITRLDAMNPRMDRAFPSRSAVREPVAHGRKKRLNRTKVEWQGTLSRRRTDVLRRAIRSRAALTGLGNALESVAGTRTALPAAISGRIHAVDGAIAEYEARNEGQHIVYATFRAPYDAGSSRAAVRNRIAAMIADPDRHHPLVADGYIPATHTLGNLADSRDLVMEIRTRSGAYLGLSDSRPEADHLVGRGRHLKPVAMYEATYTRPDGTQGRRTIVQMDDVTPI